jgi:hypothetical protein
VSEFVRERDGDTQRQRKREGERGGRDHDHVIKSTISNSNSLEIDMAIDSICKREREKDEWFVDGRGVD